MSCAQTASATPGFAPAAAAQQNLKPRCFSVATSVVDEVGATNKQFNEARIFHIQEIQSCIAQHGCKCNVEVGYDRIVCLRESHLYLSFASVIFASVIRICHLYLLSSSVICICHLYLYLRARARMRVLAFVVLRRRLRRK